MKDENNFENNYYIYYLTLFFYEISCVIKLQTRINHATYKNLFSKKFINNYKNNSVISHYSRQFFRAISCAKVMIHRISFISYNIRNKSFLREQIVFYTSNLTVPWDVGPASVERIDEAAAIVVG